MNSGLNSLNVYPSLGESLDNLAVIFLLYFYLDKGELV
jgi:hypothetical protein